MTINFNVTGGRRKELAHALGEILLWNPVYTGAPTFAYKVGNYTVDKNGTITCPPSATEDILRQIIVKLEAAGFTPEPIEHDTLVIELPRSLFSTDQMDRLREIIGSKAELFKRAFKTASLSLEMTEEKLGFPWFHPEGVGGEAEAYAHFISALGKMARQRHRITAKPYSGTNDKFVMRLFLVQLGLKGPEYKNARRILLKNLSGNSAWKNGASNEQEVTK